MLRELPLKPLATCRRQELLGLLAMLEQQIGKLDQAVQQAANQHPPAKSLMPNRESVFFVSPFANALEAGEGSARHRLPPAFSIFGGN